MSHSPGLRALAAALAWSVTTGASAGVPIMEEPARPQARAPSFGAIDGDGDGYLRVWEVQQELQLSDELFHRADGNNDSRLDPREYRSAVQLMQSAGPGSAPQLPPEDAPARAAAGEGVYDQAEITSELLRLNAGELVGRAVATPGGEDLGEIERVVQKKRDRSLYAVTSVGGFLGVGEKKIAIPLEQVELADEGLITTVEFGGLNLDTRFKQTEPNYVAIAPEQRLAAVTPREGGDVSEAFRQADQDKDGYLQQGEVPEDSALAGRWENVDEDGDGRIDMAEFAAFIEQSRIADPVEEP